jgi:ribosomal protein L29
VREVRRTIAQIKTLQNQRAKAQSSNASGAQA